MVSEIPRVSLFIYCPYSVTFPNMTIIINYYISCRYGVSPLIYYNIVNLLFLQLFSTHLFYNTNIDIVVGYM